MSQLFEITEGRTLEFEDPFVLKKGGAPWDFAGFVAAQFALNLLDKDGASVTPGGTLRLSIDSASGEVFYTPVADDFKAARAPYTVHIAVTDGDGKVVHFPEGKGPTIAVYPA